MIVYVCARYAYSFFYLFAIQPLRSLFFWAAFWTWVSKAHRHTCARACVAGLGCVCDGPAGQLLLATFALVMINRDYGE
jgi:hypothetical protein